MAAEVGAYYLTVIPSLAGAKRQIEAQLGQVDTEKAGAGLGRSLSSGVAKTVSFESVAENFDRLGGRLSAAGQKLTSTITKPFMLGAAAAGGAATLIGKSALDAYATWEQVTGGVDTLFKESSGTVQKYAAQSYKTAGISANKYMEQVTSFSASLLQSLGGDTARAADMGNMAIIDMADNANKMGTNLTDIQNAYQGFAKQNYTMLDNLKLGYGGTQSEMKRLIADANRVKQANGEMADLSINSFADVVEAIHTVQTEMGITGTTAEEAASTIEGSVASMKAAWTNWLTELGKTDGDLSGVTQKLTDAVVTAFHNVVPRVKQIFSSLGESLPTLWAGLKAELPPVFDPLISKIETVIGWVTGLDEATKKQIVTLAGVAVAAGPVLSVLGSIMTGIGGLVGLVGKIAPAMSGAAGGASGLLGVLGRFLGPVGIVISAFAALWASSDEFRQGIMDVGTAIWDVIQQIITAVQPIVDLVVTTLLPVIGQVGDLIGGLLTTLAPLITSVGTMISGIITAAMPIVNFILQLLLPVIDNILTVVSTVFAAIQPIISAAVQIIGGIISVFTAVLQGDWSAAWDGIKSILEGAWNLIKGIVQGAISIVKSVITSTLNVIKNAWNTAWDVMKNLIPRIWDGISNGVTSGINKVMGFVRGIKTKITDFFSGAGTWLLDSGKKIIGGLIDGVKSMISSVTDAFGGVMQAARNFLPFSPAKEGPFSGRGWALYSGQSIVEALAVGAAQRSKMFTGVMADTMAAGQSVLSGGLGVEFWHGANRMSEKLDGGQFAGPTTWVLVMRDADGFKEIARGEIDDALEPVSGGALASQFGIN